MVLAITDSYMQQIIDGTKTFEFRKYNMAGVQRIWFYHTAPHSAVTHVCEVDSAVKRSPGQDLIPEDGLGNLEYNQSHPDWNGYDFAYRIKSICAIDAPTGIRWAEMKNKHGMNMPPRGRMSLPHSIQQQFPWDHQTKIR